MFGIYFDFSLKKYDFFSEKATYIGFFPRNHTKKATYIRGRLHQTKVCIMHSRWGRGACRGGKRVHFGQKRPPLLGPSVSFCGASANFPFHAPRRGGRTGGAPCGTGEGDLPLMHSWPLQSGPFQQKWSSRNALKFMILSIKLGILSSSHRANINLFRSNLGKRRSGFRVEIK